MIDAFLAGEDWEEPPPSMAFEAPYGSILDEVASLVSELRVSQNARPGHERDLRDAYPRDDATRAVRLYTRVPALVNVILNYKICVEHGLPLHPTVYYELAEARRYKLDRPIGELEAANRLYRSSIDLARAAYRLDTGFEELALDFRARLPPPVPSFVYTGGGDKYTWRGAEPGKLRILSAAITKAFKPELIVAAAHGAIMPALLLAEYLGLPLYFIRFSMFKRKDESPILSFADQAYLEHWRESLVLIYDEDVAKGTTLEIFSRRMAPLFAESKTACSIRHAGSFFRPDFSAKTWWE